MRRLKGSMELLFDSVEQITHLVERTHNSTARKVFDPLSSVPPLAPVTTGVRVVHDLTAGGVYTGIRGVNRCLAALARLGMEVAQGSGASPQVRGPTAAESTGLVDHAEAAVNGFYGDFLRRRENSLDLGMGLRQSGQVLPVRRTELAKNVSEPTGKIVLFAHGLACTEWIWNISAEEFHGDPSTSFGSMLQDELGYTPLYLRYNSGLHISENGRQLSALLAQLVAEHPVPVEEIILVGHSMGGLVIRSAAHYGAAEDEPWVEQLRHVFCIGSPHLGAPLEKSVNLLTSLLRAVNTAGTRVPAELLDARSVGIKDLRFGYTLDEEWQGEDPDSFLNDKRVNAPLLDGVGYYAIGATLTSDPKHPLGVLLGDLLVRLPSATGKAAAPEQRIPFRSDRVSSGMTHLHMANHPEVYDVIKQQLVAG